MLQGAERVDVPATGDMDLSFRSWLSASAARARVEVCVDGATWEAIGTVSPSDTWVPVEIGVAAYRGQSIFVRFVLEGGAPTDYWLIELAEDGAVIR